MSSTTQNGSVTARKRFNCQTCCYACVRPSELKMHLLVHSREKPFSCKDCQAQFTQLSSFKRHHLRVHIREKKFKCCSCDYAGATKDNLVAHMRVHLNLVDKPFSCTECDRTFSTGGLLKKHQLVAHAKDKRLKCPLCKYSCTWPSTLKTHQLVHSKKKTIKCAKCGKWFFRKSHLVRHDLTDHSNHKWLKCSLCKYLCATKENLIVHLSSHLAKKTHKCEKCKAAFTTPARLQRHNIVVHGKEKRYKCFLCNYDSYYKSNIETHKQTHYNQSNFKYFKIIDLKNSLPNKVDEVEKETFKCGMCQITFENKPALKLHIMGHTGFAPFTCSICSSTFKVEKSLKQHIANLHQENK